MHQAILRFTADEDGAVTVDWVILTAAIVGLAIALILSVSGGVNDLAGYIMQALMDGEVATLDGLATAGSGLPPTTP